MGFRICYLASKAPPDKLVDALTLTLGEPAIEMPDGQWWVARLINGGWTILWSEDEVFGQHSVEQVAKLSKQYETYICEVNETIMFSSAEFWRKGEQVWKVTHYSEGVDIFDLSETGNLPDGYSELKQKHTSAQHDDSDGVDHIFEVPLDIAALDIGFRHGTYLEQSDVEGFLTVVTPRKKSLISRIFGR